MSGMSLMSSYGGELSSSVPDMSSALNASQQDSSGDSVRSNRSLTASPISTGPSKTLNRPPGLGVTVPSTIGKPGHSYNSSASTSHTQNLTLTPTSSLDGASDLYSMGRQSSPFHGDGPSMSSDYSRRVKEEGSDLPGISGLGSFDADDGEHDGLLGLQALRDRAHSSPGPINTSYSSSPPIRGQIAGFDDGRHGAMPEPRRPRAVSRDGGRPTSKPPLSGGPALSPHITESRSFQGDRSLSGMAAPFSNSRREPSPPRDMSGLGIISRPGYTEGSDRYDSALRRSISTDTGREPRQARETDRSQSSIDELSHRFGQLSSLGGSHIPPPQPLQRHQRSLSQPGPARGPHVQQDYYQDHQYGMGIASNRLPPAADSDYGDHHYQHQGQYARADNLAHNRSNSYGLGLSSTFDQAVINRRSSHQSLPGQNSGFYGQQVLPRRESLDFVPGHSRYPDGGPVVASNEDMRVFSNDGGAAYHRHVSPSQSPLPSSYGGHIRASSDMGAATASPMSVGSAIVSARTGITFAHVAASSHTLSLLQRGVPHQAHDMYPGQSHHQPSASDDDLSHPLLGEHIDVPDDRGYVPNNRMAQPSHVRHGSLGHGPHYGGAEASRRLPTAGASVPAPRVVYNVKFKRTQRAFALGPRLNRDLKVGTYVKVEADRGEDLGIMIGKVPGGEKLSGSGRSSFRGEMGMVSPQGSSGGNDLKRIIRLATHDEVALLQNKREEEEELLKICRAKVRQRGLPMNVVDAEYQFDRHKLTFFFEAEGRVDFRELVRDLFSMYKTRIWMQQLDKSTSASCPTANTQPQPVVMDYGTPIIAPESEYQ